MSTRSPGSPSTRPSNDASRKGGRLLRRLLDPAAQRTSPAKKTVSVGVDSSSGSFDASEDRSALEMVRAAEFARRQTRETPRQLVLKLARVDGAKVSEARAFDVGGGLAAANLDGSVRRSTRLKRKLSPNLEPAVDLHETPADVDAGTPVLIPFPRPRTRKRARASSEEEEEQEEEEAPKLAGSLAEDPDRTPAEAANPLTRKLRPRRRISAEPPEPAEKTSRNATDESSVADDVENVSSGRRAANALKRRTFKRPMERRNTERSDVVGKSSFARSPEVSVTERTLQRGVSAGGLKAIRSARRRRMADDFAGIKHAEEEERSTSLMKKRRAEPINAFDYGDEEEEEEEDSADRLGEGEPVLANISPNDSSFRPTAESTRFGEKQLSSTRGDASVQSSSGASRLSLRRTRTVPQAVPDAEEQTVEDLQPPNISRRRTTMRDVTNVERGGTRRLKKSTVAKLRELGCLLDEDEDGFDLTPSPEVVVAEPEAAAAAATTKKAAARARSRKVIGSNHLMPTKEIAYHFHRYFGDGPSLNNKCMSIVKEAVENFNLAFFEDLKAVGDGKQPRKGKRKRKRRKLRLKDVKRLLKRYGLIPDEESNLHLYHAINKVMEEKDSYELVPTRLFDGTPDSYTLPKDLWDV